MEIKIEFKVNNITFNNITFHNICWVNMNKDEMII